MKRQNKMAVRNTSTGKYARLLPEDESGEFRYKTVSEPRAMPAGDAKFFAAILGSKWKAVPLTGQFVEAKG